MSSVKDNNFVIKFNFDPVPGFVGGVFDPNRAIDSSGNPLTDVAITAQSPQLFGDVKADRDNQVVPAEFFLNWIKGGVCFAMRANNSTPSKLHFAFAMTIEVDFKGKIYTNDNIILGQGSAHSDPIPTNNWWIGGPDMRFPDPKYDPITASLMVAMYQKDERSTYLEFPIFADNDDHHFRLDNARY